MPRSFIRKHSISVLIFLSALLIVAALVAASSGAAPIPLLSYLIGKANWKEGFSVILFQIRLPRIVLAILVGAALAIAGAVYQAIFKNHLADPYIIGVSAGAGLGATIGIVLNIGQHSLGIYAIPVLAFVGGLLTIILVYQIARVGTRVPVTSLLLAGLAVSSTLAALMSLIMVLGGKDLHTVVFWLMGGLSTANWDQVKMALPLILIGLPIPFFFTRELNVMLLGEERAQHLGVEIEQVKKILLTAASMVTAAAVAVSGLVGFIGLMVPHLVRLVIGPEHRWLLPISLLCGAILLLVADTLARSILNPVEIPVGIVTAILGGPFFLFLLYKKRRSF